MLPSSPLNIPGFKLPIAPIALFYSKLQEALAVQTKNITKRVLLKQRLVCEDFAWYVDNVYPDLLSKAKDITLLDSAVIEAKRSEIVKNFKLKMPQLF